MIARYSAPVCLAYDRVMVAADNLGVSASGFIRMVVTRALRDDTLSKVS